MRECGILMPVASLPGPYGIGSFGRQAYQFVDFLAAAGQQVWQILPLAPTGYGDSPYQSCSAFAGNPYFVDLDTLEQEGLLLPGEYQAQPWGETPDRVDYGAVYQHRFAVLRLAHQRFLANPAADYPAFCQQNQAWLEDYALYMAAKGENGMGHWRTWPQALRRRQPQALAELKATAAQDIDFWQFVQYQFSRQWQALKAYANDNGLRILGDIPIYVADDSADTWAGEDLFETDEAGAPRRVAGCPPDYFAADGQLWGNPLYDWEHHRATGYAWWVGRVRHALRLYDLLRIDHFRAFDTYYAIPAQETTARQGVWEQGPGMELFDALKAQLGQLPIIAEDLGLLFDSVRELLKKSGFPGMKVLQFAFDPWSDSEYLPHNHLPNSVVYPGTHDNATTAAWLQAASEGELAKAKAYLSLTEEEGYLAGFLRGVLASCSDLAVIPAADWLGLGDEGRVNTPGTATGNWQWRAKPDAFDPGLAQAIRKTCALYGRAAR